MHGCPFRHHSETGLTSLLHSTLGSTMSNADLKEILAATKNGHYHVACTRVFELQHAKLPGGASVQKGDGLGGGDSVDHPNRYFDASRKAIKEARDKLKQEEDAMDGSVKPQQGLPKKAESVAPSIKPEQDAMDVDGA